MFNNTYGTFKTINFSIDNFYGPNDTTPTATSYDRFYLLCWRTWCTKLVWFDTYLLLYMIFAGQQCKTEFIPHLRPVHVFATNFNYQIHCQNWFTVNLNCKSCFVLTHQILTNVLFTLNLTSHNGCYPLVVWFNVNKTLQEKCC